MLQRQTQNSRTGTYGNTKKEGSTIDINYRYKSKNEPIIEEICEFIKTKPYGATITFTEIARQIGMNLELEESMKYFKRLMGKAKNVLIDYSYILKTVAGIGYYILKPTQIPSYTYRTYIIKPQRAYEKAKRILDRTDRSKYKKINQEEYEDVTKLNNQMIEVSDYTIFNSDYYENKKKYEKCEE